MKKDKHIDAIDTPLEHKEESLIAAAKQAEAEDETSAAIRLYEQVIRSDKLNELAYDRLMILYRKTKAYAKELKLITSAIKAYDQYYKKGKAKHKKTITDISTKINRAFGLVDKKGNELFLPEPIGRWNKRKLILERKIG